VLPIGTHPDAVLLALLTRDGFGVVLLTRDSPLEQTLDVSPGSPLSVPLSCPSLSSPRQCRDKSRGPSLLDAGELQGDRGPLDKMSVIMKRDLVVWW
jgi:hypothetical protein